MEKPLLCTTQYCNSKQALTGQSSEINVLQWAAPPAPQAATPLLLRQPTAKFWGKPLPCSRLTASASAEAVMGAVEPAEDTTPPLTARRAAAHHEVLTA